MAWDSGDSNHLNRLTATTQKIEKHLAALIEEQRKTNGLLVEFIGAVTKVLATRDEAKQSDGKTVTVGARRAE